MSSFINYPSVELSLIQYRGIIFSKDRIQLQNNLKRSKNQKNNFGTNSYLKSII